MDRHTHRERKRRESAKENMDTRNENCVYNAVMATAAVAVSMVAASEAATVTTKATYTHAPLDSLTIAILTAVAHSCLIFFFFAITAAAAASSMFLFEIFFFLLLSVQAYCRQTHMRFVCCCCSWYHAFI